MQSMFVPLLSTLKYATRFHLMSIMENWCFCRLTQHTTLWNKPPMVDHFCSKDRSTRIKIHYTTRRCVFCELLFLMICLHGSYRNTMYRQSNDRCNYMFNSLWFHFVYYNSQGIYTGHCLWWLFLSDSK